MVALAAPNTSHALARAGMLIHMDEDTPTTEAPAFTPENIKARREAMELSQTKLGAMLNPPASQRTIVHWEKGDFEVKSPRREQLANILRLALPGYTAPAALSLVGSSNEDAQLRTNLIQARALIDATLEQLARR